MSAEGGLFVSTSQFVQDVLPQVMCGRDAFRTLLATYNDFEMPPVGTIPRGLSIRALMGNRRTPEDCRDELERIFTDPLGENDRWVEQQRRRLAAVASAPLSATGYDLAVVYIGLSQFERAITYALRLSRAKAARTVVVLTCDCDDQRKERVLRPLVTRGDLRSAILTERCGGCADFGELARGLIEVWSRVRAH